MTIAILRFALAFGFVGQTTTVGTVRGATPTSPAASAPAVAPDPDALRRDARDRFDEGRFAEAAVLLEELYAIDPRPEYLYSRGQALRLAGDCAAAIGALDAFLATGPPEPDVADAERWIARCRAHLAGAAPPVQPAESPPIVHQPPADPPAPRAKPRWYRDPLGGVLFGVGLAGIATGAGLYGGSVRIAHAHPQDETHAAHVDRTARVERLAVAGWSVLGIGSALVVGAIIRYAIVHRRAQRAALARRISR